MNWRIAGLSIVAATLLGCAGGGERSPARGEQELYEAIAAADVRYVLLTRSEGAAEAQHFDGEIVAYSGIEEMDDLAATLSKEHIEHHLQEQRAAEMPD